MPHQTVFPGVRIPPSAKLAASEPLKMSPVSDSLAPSTPADDDDMFAWLAPACEEFEQSTPPQSPCISIADDPLLFDLDMGSETDPVTPDALFSISDLMDVDGQGMGFHQGIDSDFDLGLPNRDSTLKEQEAIEINTFVSDVLSETQDSLTSANGDIKAAATRPVVPNIQLTTAMAAPTLSQTIENIALEQLSPPSLQRIDGTISEKTMSPTAKRSPKRSPSRKASTKAEAPVAAIAKSRGSSFHREEGAEKVPPGGPVEVMKGVKSMQLSLIQLSQRKRPRATSVGEETRGKEGNACEKNGRSESSQAKAVKVGMRFRRKGGERRVGRVLEDEKNVPVLDKCVKCSTMARNTPMMRKGPDGCRSLCNACGLKWSRHGIF